MGTPSRILELLNIGMFDFILLYEIMLIRTKGALSFHDLQRVVVDCSYVDVKKRGIFDMIETQKPLLQLLNRFELKSRYNSTDGKIDLLFY